MPPRSVTGAVRHRIVCRFSVPRPEPAVLDSHADPRWLERRFELFERWFAPSVGRLGVPVVLLCSTASAASVAERLCRHEWVSVEIEDDFRGGTAATDVDWTTRLDSDDAVSEEWFPALERVPAEFEVAVTRRFLRLDVSNGRLHAYRRREPSPLAAFRPGLEIYRSNHADLDQRFRCFEIDLACLLQVFHGGNLCSQRPRWWRPLRRISRRRLRPFGIH
jgi:hypothetical protein